MRILCCGNRYRGDDAAGLLVADRLQELGLAAQTLGGEVRDHGSLEWGRVCDPG